MSNSQPQHPHWKGMAWYRDPYYGFEFFYASDWVKCAWADDRHGVLFSPTPDNLHTIFGVSVADLDALVTPDDLDLLAEFALEAIRQLPDAEIRATHTWSAGKLLCIEVNYDYLDGEQARRRWVKLFYEADRQVTVLAQGATAADFQYWLPMFNQAMRTFILYAYPGYRREGQPIQSRK